jgi:hypothetical protein
MYEALGFKGKTGLLVTGIYNTIGPVTSGYPSFSTPSSSRR